MPRHPIPDNALHAHYAATGGHADCYAAIIPRRARDKREGVSLAAFVFAFYTSPLFRLERWILAVVLGMPSTDAEARAVAVGEAPFDVPGTKGCATARFAAWTFEARSDDQLVMCDYQGRTRLWFMVLRLAQDGREEGTRVYFGTAIAASRGGRVPFAFRALMPFHHLYSRALLWSAVRGLRATR
ncbi:MAG: hypothetical protein V4696_14430 [Pseudomonadota bacterium]